MVEGPVGNAARLAESPIADGGTTAEEWTGWDHRFDPLDLDDCPGLTVVAPHPDDETFGLGATIATLCAVGVDVQVVSVSDGEAAYADADRGELKTLRWNEIRDSMRVLGAREPIRLQLPDGELGENEPDLTDRLVALLAERPDGAWCAATWRSDGHPDHEAVGRAAATAAATTGARLLEYPVWMWHWAQPGDDAVPWSRARRIEPSPRAVDLKKAAAKCFPTQTRSTRMRYPVLPPHVVRRFLAVGEVVFV